MAEEFKYISVSKMLREVSSTEISEWQAYFNVKDKILKINKAANEAQKRAKKQ